MVLGKGQLTAARTAAMLERRYQVLSLRRDGLSIPEIAKELGCAAATVREDIKEVLEQVVSATAETTEELRHLQLARLDKLLKIHMKLAEGYEELVEGKDGKMHQIVHPPNHNSAAIILQLEARRAKLMNLDIPESKGTDEGGVRVYVGVNIDQV